MKIYLQTILLACCLAFIPSCKTTKSSASKAGNKIIFDTQQIFMDERFPNVVVAKDGTVIAVWGRKNFRVRRSEDGGNTWGPEITVANPGFHGGGTTIDENTG